MAPATRSIILFQCVIIISSCYWNLLLVNGWRELPAYHHPCKQHQDHHHHVSQGKACVGNSARRSGNTIPAKGYKQQLQGLEIIHRHGPCSPFGQPNSPPNHHRILFQDRLRVDSINSNGTTASTPLNSYGEGVKLPVSGHSIGDGNFVVKIGLGTNPVRDLNLILDTGSDLTWTQCKNCTECYSQEDEIFDPSTSPTFSKPPCDIPECTYSMKYFDGSHSYGYMARDTLTIGNSISLSGFIFGCGLNNSDDFGRAAGILGLGQSGNLSFLPQTETSFSEIFCYCLPKDYHSSGHLLFGMQALKTCQTEKYTPIISDSDKPHLYFVNLKGITIGQQHQDITGKTIIDSGTVISRLPPSIYQGVLSEFEKSMANFSVAEAASTLLKSCYNLEGSFQDATIPPVVLHLDNVDLSLDSSGVVWREKGDSQVCLAFAPNEDENQLIIIGNHQHLSMNLLYNVQDRKLEFGETGAC